MLLPPGFEITCNMRVPYVTITFIFLLSIYALSFCKNAKPAGSGGASLGRLRQENGPQFEVSMGAIGSACLFTTRTTKGSALESSLVFFCIKVSLYPNVYVFIPYSIQYCLYSNNTVLFVF